MVSQPGHQLITVDLDPLLTSIEEDGQSPLLPRQHERRQRVGMVGGGRGYFGDKNG